MKRLSIIAGLALAMLCSMGCSKFEYIFSGNDPSVIEPVTSEDGEYSINDSYAYFQYILEYNGVGFDINQNEASAIVINAKEQMGPLEDIILTGWEPLCPTLPDIDFSKYSLVIGTYLNTGGYTCDTRIKKTAKGLDLYQKVYRAGNGGFTQVTLSPFAAIYPKLPDAEVNIISWTVQD